MKRVNRLEVQSCLTLLKDKSLHEILIYLDDNANSSVNQICDSADFWEAIIDKFYGPMFLEQRKDIDRRDFRLLINDLIDGVETNYGIVVNLEPPERKISNPIIIENIDDQPFLDGANDYRITFIIEGLRPLPKTKGYIAEYHFTIGGIPSYREIIYFLGKKNDDLDEIARNFKAYTAIKAYNDLISVSEDYDRTFSGWIELDKNDPKSKDQFIQAYTSQKFKINPSLVTEIFLNLDSNSDTYVQVWVAEVEF